MSHERDALIALRDEFQQWAEWENHGTPESNAKKQAYLNCTREVEAKIKSLDKQSALVQTEARPQVKKLASEVRSVASLIRRKSVLSTDETQAVMRLDDWADRLWRLYESLPPSPPEP